MNYSKPCPFKPSRSLQKTCWTMLDCDYHQILDADTHLRMIKRLRTWRTLIQMMEQTTLYPQIYGLTAWRHATSILTKNTSESSRCCGSSHWSSVMLSCCKARRNSSKLPDLKATKATKATKAIKATAKHSKASFKAYLKAYSSMFSPRKCLKIRLNVWR